MDTISELMANSPGLLEHYNALQDFVRQNQNKRNILLIPPDYTRYYSMAGEITAVLYSLFNRFANVRVLPAVGTHMPLSNREKEKMFPGVPDSIFMNHDWRVDTRRIGEISSDFVAQASNGLFRDSIGIEVNSLLLDNHFDLLVSIGQVVPHEVAGMANYSKNIFVGLGGRQMINKTHMMSAICGIENTLGRTDTPVRRVFDKAQESLRLPLEYILTVTTVEDKPGTREKHARLHGLFIGGREAFLCAAKLSQELNITDLPKPVKKVICYLDEFEFKTAWVGNKAIYRSRMAIEDGGELIILAPGVRAFGENPEADAEIRKYGYRGYDDIIMQYEQGAFDGKLMIAAHLLHGSSNGRFKIIYATRPKNLSAGEIESAGFSYEDYENAVNRHNANELTEGYNVLPDGSEVYYIGAPASGFWRAQ